MDYTSLLIIDCRTALWEKAADIPAGQTEEIIALDVAVIDTNKNQIVESEAFLIKPHKAKVSKYCENLFGISQMSLDKNGVPWEDVYRKLRVHYMSRDKIWGTWGSYDKYVIDQQCKHFELEHLFRLTYHDLQKLYSTMIGLDTETKYLSVSQALQYSAEPLDSNRAINVAHLWIRMAAGLRQKTKTRIVTPQMFRTN